MAKKITNMKIRHDAPAPARLKDKHGATETPQRKGKVLPYEGESKTRTKS